MEQRESDLAVVCRLAHEHLLADGPAGRNDVLRPKGGPLVLGGSRAVEFLVLPACLLCHFLSVQAAAT